MYRLSDVPLGMTYRMSLWLFSHSAFSSDLLGSQKKIRVIPIVRSRARTIYATLRTAFTSSLNVRLSYKVAYYAALYDNIDRKSL